MRLIVGLGNPEVKYEKTRHNFGFLVLRALAEEWQCSFRKSSLIHGVVGKSMVEGRDCCLLLPMTYMNNSGVAVKALLKQKQLGLSDILVVCDDLTLDFGALRIRPRGGAGGHNGLKSIIEHLGGSDFARLRLGVGATPVGCDQADYVLSNFTAAQQKVLPDIVIKAVSCCHSWVAEGTEAAMNRFNGSIIHHKQKEQT